MSERTTTITPANRPSNRPLQHIGHGGALPAPLEPYQAVDRVLAPLAELVRESGWYVGYKPKVKLIGPHAHFHGPVAVAEARQTLAKVAAQVAEVWGAVDRPATAMEIMLNIRDLVACFPSGDKRTAEEKRIFQHLMCNDVANSKPTLYALQAGCERLRRKFHFQQQLQIADVIDALAKGKAKGEHRRLLIEAIPHMHKNLDVIEQAERERERRRDPAWEAARAAKEAARAAKMAAEMAADRAQAEAEAWQKLRRRIELGWPPFNPFDWKRDDLRRLGLTELCDPRTFELSWDGLKELQKIERSVMLVRLDRLAAAEQNAENDAQAGGDGDG